MVTEKKQFTALRTKGAGDKESAKNTEVILKIRQDHRIIVDGNEKTKIQ